MRDKHFFLPELSHVLFINQNVFEFPIYYSFFSFNFSFSFTFQLIIKAEAFLLQKEYHIRLINFLSLFPEWPRCHAALHLSWKCSPFKWLQLQKEKNDSTNSTSVRRPWPISVFYLIPWHVNGHLQLNTNPTCGLKGCFNFLTDITSTSVCT